MIVGRDLDFFAIVSPARPTVYPSSRMFLPAT
jgi:hypothetical protein